MSSSSFLLCDECDSGLYADTLVCDMCLDDVCQKDKCGNASGYTCKGCVTTWCDGCLDEVVHCEFCDCCAVCDPAIYPCEGCEEDTNVLVESIPFIACTKCRLERKWTMRTNDWSGEIVVCCPSHPHGSAIVHEPLSENAFPPMKLHEALIV